MNEKTPPMVLPDHDKASRAACIPLIQVFNKPRPPMRCNSFWPINIASYHQYYGEISLGTPLDGIRSNKWPSKPPLVIQFVISVKAEVASFDPLERHGRQAGVVAGAGYQLPKAVTICILGLNFQSQPCSPATSLTVDIDY
jgi:hypothetical protein